MKKSLFMIVGVVFAVLVTQTTLAAIDFPLVVFTEYANGDLKESFTDGSVTTFVGDWMRAPGNSQDGMQKWYNSIPGEPGDIYDFSTSLGLPVWQEPDNPNLYNYVEQGTAFSDAAMPDHFDQRPAPDSTPLLATYSNGPDNSLYVYVKFVDLGDSVSVPEPSDFALTAAALLALFIVRRRTKKIGRSIPP